MQAKKLFIKSPLGDGLALIAGALLTLAFAPFGIFPLAILSPAILLTLWLNVSKWRAFVRGWLFGLGFFGAGVYWVFISVHTFGNTSTPVALLVTASLIGVLALFPAANGYVLTRYFPKNNYTKLLCAFPAIWVLLEWTRSWIFSGFPWLFLGYSQINSPLKGFAPIFSVYGVSLAVTFTAALLVIAIWRARQSNYKAMYFCLLAIALMWATGSLLSFINWTKPEGPLIKISLVQGNIPQSLKWSPEQVRPTLDRYHQLTSQHWDSRIIIWPEAAVPLVYQDAEDFLNTMDNEALKKHSAIITGIPVGASQPGSYYNAVVVLGNGDGFYTKQRLVPFGEFVPLHDLVGKLFSIMQIPMSDFIPGPKNLKPLLIGHVKIATFICYEIAFPEQVLERDGSIGMLLTVSNDAWFGHSIAQAQHLEMGQMRALEMGRPVLFVSNNGITAFINPTGKVQSVAPPFETTVLTDSIQAFTGKTLWQRLGMDPILLILLLLIFAAVRFRK